MRQTLAQMLDESNLHSYQRDLAEFLAEGDQSLAFVEMGLGKTVSTLTAIRRIIDKDWREKRMKRRFLVVAPRRVALHVWPKEVKKWAHLQGLRVAVAIGTPGKRLYAIVDPNADIVCINYENLEWLLKQFPQGKLPFYGVVFDEVDKMKAPGTKRFKALRYRVDEFKWRVGMTGTPAPESLQNVWGPAYLVTADEKRRVNGRKVMDSPVGSSYERFCSNYFNSDYNGFKLEPREGSFRAIGELLAPYTFSAQAKDHLDLPELIVQDHVFELPAKARKQYDDFEREFVLALERGDELAEDDSWDEAFAEAANAAVLKNKLRQVCSGFVYHYTETRERKTAWLHNHKVDAYKDVVGELMGEPHLAVYGYQAEHEKLGFKHRLGGGISDGDEQEILRKWDNREITTLAMHPASAGHGLNLHEGGAHHICFLTLPWSRGLYDQTVARLHRMGQGKRVVVHRFVALNTVEESVVEALESKGQVQQQVITALKRRQKR